MTKTESEIKIDIKNYIEQCGGSYSSWYVGVACYPKTRLFDDHGVNEKTDAWIFRQALNSEIARRIEKYFIEVLCTDGGLGGGDENTDVVYAYKKKVNTNP